MKNYKVLLGDSEESFVVALMNYINRNRQLPILAMAFTTPADLEVYLSAHKADLLVISSGWERAELLRKDLNIPLLRIVEEEGELVQGDRDEGYISKYTPGSGYVRRILGILSQKRVFLGQEGSCTCMVVYSPIGRCGKTRLSHALCASHSCKEGIAEGRTLYLGMEEYGNPSTEYHGMEELLYYVKQKSSNLSMKMKAIAKEEAGYDKLFSPLAYQELRELQKDDVAFLLNAIRKEGFYSFLLADIGSGSLVTLEILAEFDVIYLPYLRNTEAQNKLWAFCQVLKNLNVWDRISRNCYPILLEDRQINLEDVRELEQLRQSGKLPALEDYFNGVSVS